MRAGLLVGVIAMLSGAAGVRAGVAPAGLDVFQETDFGGSSGSSAGGELGLITIDGNYFIELSPRFDLSFGDFALGLQVPLR